MPSRKQEIEQLDSEIARLEQKITSECVEIGKRISKSGPEDVRHPELKKYLQNIRSLRNTIDHTRAEVTRLEKLFKRMIALDKKVEENEKRIRELIREREARLADLGAGAYTLFRKLTEKDRYSSMFDEVIKIDDEIEKHSRNLSAIEAEEKNAGFFEKLKLKTRKVVLRGNISKIDKKKMKADAEAGERVADSDFASLASGELQNLFEFVAVKRRAIESIHKENDQLRDELSSIRAELKEHRCEDGTDEARKRLDERVQDIEKEMDVMFCWTGQLYVERDLRDEIPDDGVAAKFDIIGGTRESIVKRRQQINKLRAEEELQELQKKEKTLVSRRKQIEEEVRVKERQINVIDIEINTGRRRMDELDKVLRGEAPFTEANPLPPPPDFYPRKPDEPLDGAREKPESESA